MGETAKNFRGNTFLPHFVEEIKLLEMELNWQKLNSYDHVKAKNKVWETVGYVWDQIAKKEGSNNAENQKNRNHFYYNYWATSTVGLINQNIWRQTDGALDLVAKKREVTRTTTTAAAAVILWLVRVVIRYKDFNFDTIFWKYRDIDIFNMISM